MNALWRWVSLRHLLHEGGRSCLALLGVALGVAVFVSIRLANHSALASFSDTVDVVAGKANLQIVGDSGGFGQELLARLTGTPGLIGAAPVLRVYARARFDSPDVPAADYREAYPETLLLLGLDPEREVPFGRIRQDERLPQIAAAPLGMDPGAVVVTGALARRHRLVVGDSFRMLASGHEVHPLVVRIVDDEALNQAMGGNVVLMRLPTAQLLFNRLGKLDAIDLLAVPSQRESVRAAITERLPAGLRVTNPEARTRQVESMVEAFALNLAALAFIALFVSMFLIFNSVSMSVLRRRAEIGMLRGVGGTRGEVLRLFLVEALVLGSLGSAAGLALGTLLAQGALESVTRTMSQLYVVTRASGLRPDAGLYLHGFALGVGMTLLSALAPALEAAATPPVAAMRQGVNIEAQRVPWAALAITGGLCLAAAGAVTWWTVGARRPFGGFVSAFLLLTGFALLAPGFTLAARRVLDPLVRRFGDISAVLGIRYLREAAARNAVVVGALMVASAMTIALTVMVGSFRQTVDIWIGQTIRGDLYVEPAGRDVALAAIDLPRGFVESARAIPGVAAVDTYRGIETVYRDRITFVGGIEFDVQARYGRLQFVRQTAAEALDAARERKGVVITESFSYRTRLRRGDDLELSTPAGVRRFPVTGVFFDYSTDGGYLLMDRELFETCWQPHRTERLALYLHPGTDPESVRQALLRAAPTGLMLMITPNRSLRARAMRIFDQTFRITYALQGITVIVSILGVVSTLTALILQRGREIAVLRAVGGLRAQVRRMVLVESAALGMLGGLLGCVCGLALSLLLTYVINKQFFGWTLRLTLDPGVFVQTMALMTVTATLAGIGPARAAADRPPAAAMRTD